jgi:GT2 family glycosyltransferase
VRTSPRAPRAEPEPRTDARRGSSPSLDVVIVAYRCRELLRACLESLRAHPASVPTRVYVVDNDSRDGTAAMVRSSFPEVTLIEAGANRGFAAANNLAIARGGGDFVLALNPDTLLTCGALDRLLQLLDAQPEVGMCGCRLVRGDGSFDHAARRSFPTIAGALGHFLAVGRSARAPRALAQYRAPDVDAGPVDAVNGAFMLMRRAALEQVGLFDEGFWMYMEDLDLCYRFREAGWTTWYEPSVTVVHAKAGTSGPARGPRLDYAFHYGMLRFYRKHYARRRSPLTNAAVYVGVAAKLGVSVVRSGLRRVFAQPRAAAR